MKKKQIKTIVIFTIFLLLLGSNTLFSWNGGTHQSITNQSIKTYIEDRSDSKSKNFLDVYFNNIGYSGNNESIKFPLLETYMPEEMKKRFVTQEHYDDAGNLLPSVSDFGDSQSVLEWIKLGSEKEDVPITRAINHFHDPVTGRGWDENAICTSEDFKWRVARPTRCPGYPIQIK